MALGIVFTDTAEGIRVESVIPGSPAQRAGLRRGDYLVALDGRRLESSDDARRVLRRREPGDSVRVRFERRGRVRRTVVVLQPRHALF